MDKFVILAGEPAPGKTPEEVREYFRDKTTEGDLAEALILLHQKTVWYDDIIYDYEVGTPEYLEAIKTYYKWQKLEDEFQEKVYSILRSEGIKVRNARSIYVQEIFMNRNGYEHQHGWWVKREPIEHQEGAEDIYVIMEEEPHPTVNLDNFESIFIDRNTEGDYATAYAIAHNKAFWFSAYEHDCKKGTGGRQAQAKIKDKWSALEEEYRIKLFDALEKAGIEYNDFFGYAEHLGSLMKRYSYSYISGWWVNPEDKTINRILRVPRT